MAHPDRVMLLTDALTNRGLKQTTGHLTVDVHGPNEAHCCLGVACIVAMENGVELDYIEGADGIRYFLNDNDTCAHEGLEHLPSCYSNDVVLPKKVMSWYGFTDVDPEMAVSLPDSDGGFYETTVSAATLNDDKGFDFARIAAAFEANFVHLPEEPSGVLEP